MKVVLINTSDAGGGAAVACMRLLEALQQRSVNADMLVQQKFTAQSHVIATADSALGKVKAKADFLLERVPFILFHERDKQVRFAFSTANSGTDVSANPLIQNADILHLHWTNSGYLSIHNLKQLVALNKPIVWTLHDMWAFTGGCHYSGGCQHFFNECGNCPMLSDASENDISRRGWHRKREMLNNNPNIVFVTCSNWLAGVARKSSLLKGFRIEVIPNPIDIQIFSPRDIAAARQKHGINTTSKIILFGAANIGHTRKGVVYLIEALQQLKLSYPETTDVEIVVFGKAKDFDFNTLPYKVHYLGMINNNQTLADIYNLADVFVLPSLEDNLPNMVMEAMACGTPVVAFNTGGINDMVEHKANGYIAAYQSAEDMAAGINYILNNTDYSIIASAARKKVTDNFSSGIVGAQYESLYKSLLA